ncbi:MULTISPECIES: carboxypeptidase-like regulatory domain-containing protein [Niastella]|uniref:Carboxypeptidase-like regulatory domain-containing protein n=1 Tax=Niastella soli TaxID=2821487 RepID=A0ABS3Z4C8_9BACT|nr:carboxypeptidase-like regulatory domain-containing protein [Niastella soli]MBO9205022.1 carboxypeptidase-like regulatory domain-containing protein [Niastella soli]
MPRSLRLTVPDPCHENWQKMTPQEQGRFCGSCQKVVVDFSVMTDKEMLDYFSKASQQVCGRFSNDQLNKELTLPSTRKRFTWAYAWSVLLASLIVTKSNAQGKPKVRKVDLQTHKVDVRNINLSSIAGSTLMGFTVSQSQSDPMEAAMKGVVLDAQNKQPVIGGSITIKGTKNGTMADTSGHFSLQIGLKDSLEFSAIGYETQTLVIDRTTNWGPVKVFLKPSFAALQEVTVVASGTIMGKMMQTGSVTKCVASTRLEKIQRVINDWTPAAIKKDIKIYPNPVMRGNSIQVKLNLPQTGEYRLELLNTVGQIMLIQPLFMQTKEQQIDLYTQTKWSAGAYWVRISSPKSKNVFEAKVLLQ